MDAIRARTGSRPVRRDEKNMRRAEGFLRQIEVRMPAICVKNAA